MPTTTPRIYSASRFTFGNMVFPDRIRLEEDTVVFEKRHWIGGEEESSVLAQPLVRFR